MIEMVKKYRHRLLERTQAENDGRGDTPKIEYRDFFHLIERTNPDCLCWARQKTTGGTLNHLFGCVIVFRPFGFKA